SNWSHPQFEK
nr:Chain P, STREP-TAG II PEPTIDE